MVIGLRKYHRIKYMSNTDSSKTYIAKSSIKRLLTDVKEILKSPLTEHGIYYKHDDDDMLKGCAMIIGPDDTPYYGGFYFFRFVFPNDYPHSPPKVEYCTNGDNVRFHPNFYKTGKVCVSILNTWRGDQWTSCQTLSSILLTLCSLLTKDPLLHEPGITKRHKDFYKYNSIVAYKNIEIAILNMISKGTYFPCSQFECFYDDMVSSFKNNAVTLQKYITEMEDESYKRYVCDDNLPSTTKDHHKLQIETSIYSMKVHIDFGKLCKAFAECKDKYA